MNIIRFRGRSEVGPERHHHADMRHRGWLGLLALGLLFAAASAQADPGGEAQSGAASEAARVDLNRATAEQLAELPGIGTAKAAAIVAHRNSNGAFTSVEGLEAVRGIGPAMVAKLRPHVSLGSPTRSKARSGSKAGAKTPPIAAK